MTQIKHQPKCCLRLLRQHDASVVAVGHRGDLKEPKEPENSLYRSGCNVKRGVNQFLEIIARKTIKHCIPKAHTIFYIKTFSCIYKKCTEKI